MTTSNQRFAQLNPFSLAGAGAVIGDIVLNLQSFNDINGNPLTMTSFGNLGYGTLEPGNGTLEEQISFTGITQNLNGTATLTGIRSVGFIYPYTSTSGLAKTHAGAVPFIISNTAGFYSELASTADDEVITGLYNFPAGVNNPTIGTTYIAPTTGLQIATKQYIDGVAIAGAPNATTTQAGIVLLSVNPVSGTGIVLAVNDPRVPTSGEAQALAGTSGTPSSTNLYVTNADTATSIVVSAVVRANTSGLIDSSFIENGIFGDGSDGNVTISVDTTLSTDMYYNNLTVNSGKKLTTAGYRIFVKGTLTNAGTIDNSASGTTGGLSGSLVGGASGAGPTTAGSANHGGAGGGGGGVIAIYAFNIVNTGTISANGANGTNGTTSGSGDNNATNGGAGGTSSRALGGSGGIGGATTGTTAGAAGTATAPSTPTASFRFPVQAYSLFDYINTSIIKGGGGGGSGGAYSFTSGVGDGGGGGGGGGFIFIMYHTASFNSEVANGGTHGNGVSSGANGGDGSGGTVLKIQI